MRVRVLLFAIIRDAAQTAEVDLDLSDGAAAKDAIAMLESRFPQIGKYLPRAAIAINREYATAQTVLTAGDEVALIPPVSGG